MDNIMHWDVLYLGYSALQRPVCNSSNELGTLHHPVHILLSYALTRAAALQLRSIHSQITSSLHQSWNIAEYLWLGASSLSLRALALCDVAIWHYDNNVLTHAENHCLVPPRQTTPLPTRDGRYFLSVAVTNFKNDGVAILEDSARYYEIPLILLGSNGTWTANSLRPGIQLEFLRNLSRSMGSAYKDLIVLFVDAVDTVFTGNMKSLVEQFDRVTNHNRSVVIFGAEKLCGPDPKKRDKCPVPSPPSEWKYLNAGVHIGYASTLESLFDPVNKSAHHYLSGKIKSKWARSDQLQYMMAYIGEISSGNATIKLDYYAQLVFNVFDDEKSQKRDWKTVSQPSYAFDAVETIKFHSHPSIVHGPGWVGKDCVRLHIAPQIPRKNPAYGASIWNLYHPPVPPHFATSDYKHMFNVSVCIAVFLDNVGMASDLVGVVDALRNLSFPHDRIHLWFGPNDEMPRKKMMGDDVTLGPNLFPGFQKVTITNSARSYNESFLSAVYAARNEGCNYFIGLNSHQQLLPDAIQRLIMTGKRAIKLTAGTTRNYSDYDPLRPVAEDYAVPAYMVHSDIFGHERFFRPKQLNSVRMGMHIPVYADTTTVHMVDKAPYITYTHWIKKSSAKRPPNSRRRQKTDETEPFNDPEKTTKSKKRSKMFRKRGKEDEVRK